MSFELAQKVADAVLYEGYVLYPYRASAAKNRVRWQFGVVVPRGYSELCGEPWAMQTECLVEPGAATEIDLRVRFLQVQARTIEESVDDSFRPVETLEVGDRTLVTWEEGVERCFDETIPLSNLLAAERRIAIEAPAGEEIELVHGPEGAVAGRIVRERWPVSGLVRVAAEPAGGLVKLRVRIENAGEWSRTGRDAALRRSLIGAHTLLAVRGSAFVSLLDPPPESASEAAACTNLHTWPVLIGEEGARDVVLSSPIILYDYPQVAPESPGDLCDSTEIDEILMLRVMTLTEEEKREARGTDERSRQIIERSDSIPPELFERLHGAVRSLGPSDPVQRDTGRPSGMPFETSPPGPLSRTGEGEGIADWESFLNPPGEVPPEEAFLDLGGARVAKGSRVRLRPSRRADSMDLFLAGRIARVQGIYRDVEDAAWVAVSLEDDPASDLHDWHGRFYYFYPEEVELLEPGRSTDPIPPSSGAAPSSEPPALTSPTPPLPEGEEGEKLPPRLLIAGVGNIFLGDDGFGVEVARRLAATALPEHVRVADFGIRGVHLAYELLEGSYATTVLVDAMPRGREPGTVYLLEPELDRLEEGGPALADAHGMDPRTVFALLRTLGGTPGRVLIVGCEPLRTEEEMGLSEPVSAGVDEAIRLILDLLEREAPVAAGTGNPRKEAIS